MTDIEHIIFFQLTGSTTSQLLYFPGKSVDMTWPQTEVILNLVCWFLKVPIHSCTEHAPLRPVGKQYYISIKHFSNKTQSLEIFTEILLKN